MPPPPLNRRPSMPVLNVVRDEPQPLERTRSLAAAGRSPTLGSIRSARQRAGSIAAPSGEDEGTAAASAIAFSFPVATEEEIVRPPSRAHSTLGSDVGAPAVAPQKVLVKRLKATSAAQRSAMPAPAASPLFSGDELENSRQGSQHLPSDNDTVQHSARSRRGGDSVPVVAAAVGGGYRSADGGESDAYQVMPVSLQGSGGEEERMSSAPPGGYNSGSFPHRDAASHNGGDGASRHQAPTPTIGSGNQLSRTSSVNYHPADDHSNRPIGGAVYGSDVVFRHTPDHWATPPQPPLSVNATVDSTSHAAADVYNPARPVGSVQSQRMIFENSSQPLFRSQAGGAPPPPPPPPPPAANWKLGGTTPRGTNEGSTTPPPPPAALPPPPPRRLDNYDIDQQPLPDAATVRNKVEQVQARELARIESERLQQPGRPSLTTFSRLDLGNRSSHDDDGQYSLVTDDNGNIDTGRSTVNDADDAKLNSTTGGIPAAAAADPTTPPNSVRHPSREKRTSPSRQHSSVGRAFVPVSPVAFSIEFDGMNAVLLDQLSDASLNRIVDELQSVIFDAVRGPIPNKGSIRVERITASEDSDNRTVVEGFLRGLRGASDRRLAIRLLVSYFRGPSADAIGLRLAQFPSLVRDANGVAVRRMYINDVDVALLATSSSTQNSPSHQRSDQPSGSVAAFEARRSKLSMATTPSIVGAEFHSNGTPREVSPLRYNERPSSYHHISVPTPSQQKAGYFQQPYHNSLATMTPNASAVPQAFMDPMRSPPASHQPNYSSGSQIRSGQTEVAPYHSPSNSYGVTRYRTRKYEYH